MSRLGSLFDRAAFNQGKNAKYDIGIDETGTAYSLTAKGQGAVCYGVPLNFRPENCIPHAELASTICNGTAPGTHNGLILSDGDEYIVRRLMPLECCRLFGMPDWWCADIPHKDSPEYEMWGNSIALPCAIYVLDGIRAELERAGQIEVECEENE